MVGLSVSLGCQGQAVARVAQGLDGFQRRQLFAQAADQQVDRAGLQIGLLASQLVEEPVPG